MTTARPFWPPATEKVSPFQNTSLYFLSLSLYCVSIPTIQCHLPIHSFQTFVQRLQVSMICPSSEVSPTVIALVQTLAEFLLQYTFGCSGTSRIFHKSKLCIQLYIQIYTRNTFYSKILHTGI